MSIITLAIAKEHLRAVGVDEDVTIQIYLNAAEKAASDFLNRNIYADVGTLAAAKAAAPNELAAATTAYETAIAAANLITNRVEAVIATTAAQEAYNDAQHQIEHTYRGIVINDAIQAAVLLTLGSFYEHRENEIVGASVESLHMGVRALLQPYRVGLGV